MGRIFDGAFFNVYPPALDLFFLDAFLISPCLPPFFHLVIPKDLKVRVEAVNE